mmetsp:Transcript_61361/g.163146  ORF Transcript_61361/g.163146 Transcript_61361/m.163146 type:complete len:123 (+) Transcript_61361:1549-1917(+)
MREVGDFFDKGFDPPSEPVVLPERDCHCHGVLPGETSNRESERRHSCPLCDEYEDDDEHCEVLDCESLSLDSMFEFWVRLLPVTCCKLGARRPEESLQADGGLGFGCAQQFRGVCRESVDPR